MRPPRAARSATTPASQQVPTNMITASAPRPHRARPASGPPARWAVAIVTGLLLASPAAAQPRTDVDALISKAAATYRAARTATANFEQTLTNPMTGSESVSRGVLSRQAPDRYAFVFTEPAGDRLVADGSYLWIYTPSTTPGQVIKLPARAVGAGMLDPGAQFFDSPRTRFDITDGGKVTLAGAPTHLLTLSPRGESSAPFTRARVWLDPTDGTLRQFETMDGMGVKRVVRLTDLKVNVPVPGSAFQFTPPGGVRVVDGATLTGGR